MGRNYKKVDYVTAIRCTKTMDTRNTDEIMKALEKGDLFDMKIKDQEYVDRIIKRQINEDMFKRGIISEETYRTVKYLLDESK